jgi:hypothetical protein
LASYRDGTIPVVHAKSGSRATLHLVFDHVGGDVTALTLIVGTPGSNGGITADGSSGSVLFAENQVSATAMPVPAADLVGPVRATLVTPGAGSYPLYLAAHRMLCGTGDEQSVIPLGSLSSTG